MPSSVRLMPTSMTTAPSFTYSGPIIFGRPIAATRMSASRHTAGRSAVLLWQYVTVASRSSSISAIGWPTSRERPTTTALRPRGSMPYSSSIAMTPHGVQARCPGRPRMSRPRFSGWKPSTSFTGETRATTSSTSRWRGNGCCTRIPCTSGSALSESMSASRSACAKSAGSRWSKERMPRRSQSLSFILTYDCDAGSSPTSTTARPGTTPRAFSAATFAAVRCSTIDDTCFPSMITGSMNVLPNSMLLPGRARRFRPRPERRSEEADHVAVGVDVDLLAGGVARQAGHSHDVTAQRVQEARARGETDIADGQRPAGRAALAVRVVREREVALGHAHRQAGEAHPGEPGDRALRVLGELDRVGAVDAPRHGLDLGLDRLVVGVGEDESRDGRARVGHGVCEFDAARTAVRVQGVRDSRGGPRVARRGLDQLVLGVSVGREPVDRHDHRYAEGAHVLDLLDEVRQAVGQGAEVPGRQTGIERMPWLDVEAARVALERTHRADEYRAVRSQPAHAALDVAELLEAHVRPETCLGHGVVSELERDAVRDDRGVAVRDVAERARVHEDRTALHVLQEVRHDRVLHEHRHRAGDLEVLGRDRTAVARTSHHDAADARAKVVQIGRERED